MNIAQMHQAFKLEIDKSNSLEYPSFLPEEIDFWLNKAIKTFVKTRYSGWNLKKQGFEDSQKRIEDLRTLVMEEQMVPVLDSDNTHFIDDITSYTVDLTTTSEPYWFNLSEEVAIQYTDCNGVSRTRRQFVIETTLNGYGREISNPYSEYRLEGGRARPLRIFVGNKVELVTDGNYVPVLYYLVYLRKPIEVSYTGLIDCDLTEETHDEIVSLAVNLTLENIESKRLETQSLIINKQE